MLTKEGVHLNLCCYNPFKYSVLYLKGLFLVCYYSFKSFLLLIMNRAMLCVAPLGY